MNRYLFMIAVIISVGCISHANAQCDVSKTNFLGLEREIILLEERIDHLIKKKKELSGIDGLRQFHIVWSGPNLDKYSAEQLYDLSFLKDDIILDYYVIRPRSILGKLFSKTKQFIKTTTYVTDSLGNIVASGDARYVGKAFKPSLAAVEIAKMFFDGEIVLGFNMRIASNFMALKENGELIVVERSMNSLVIKSWEEFLQQYLEEREHKAE